MGEGGCDEAGDWGDAGVGLMELLELGQGGHGGLRRVERGGMRFTIPMSYDGWSTECTYLVYISISNRVDV